jgi:hypothetical protein
MEVWHDGKVPDMVNVYSVLSNTAFAEAERFKSHCIHLDPQSQLSSVTLPRWCNVVG